MSTSNEQPRQQKSQRFSSHFTRERLRWLLRTVAKAVRPQAPDKLTQHEFDERAPGLMVELDEPPPPSARAIYMRLNKGRSGKRKSWRDLVREACDETVSDVRAESIARRERENPFIDERHVWYALRRVAQEIGRTPTPDRYDETRRTLIEADRRRNGDDAVLEDLLPTSGQILTLAADLGWSGACELAGLEPPTPAEMVIAIEPVRLAEHFYETKRRLPKFAELYAHGEQLGVPIPRFKISKVRADLTAARAARGLATPADGPEPGTELSAAELEQLLAGVTKRRPGTSWTTDRVLDALADYMREYEAKVPLRQKQYGAVRAEHGWPSNQVITRTAKELGLAGFQDVLKEAKRRARAADTDSARAA